MATKMKSRKSSCPHTHFPRGAHVCVILRDGTVIEDWYVERRRDTVVLRRAGRIRLRDVRTMSYWRHTESLLPA